MKNLNYKKYGKSLFDGKNIYGQGNVRLAVHYYKYLVEQFSKDKSITDIGCGDGILSKVRSKEIIYRGIDIGAGIYNEDDSHEISYIRNYTELIDEIKSKKTDISLLINVLEHTFDFTDLFETALNNTNDIVFVALPNEENLAARIRFLLGKGILTHTLDMHGLHVNHRHLWLIQIPLAERILVETAKKYNFKLQNKCHYLGYPNTRWKRNFYRLGVSILPWRLKANGFALTFKKITQ